jgi:molecular chaperone GrpE
VTEEQAAGDRQQVKGEPAAESPPTAAEKEASSEAQAVEQDLDELVADLKRERDEYLELAQRARADFENYRRRAARDAEDAERRGKGTLARGILPAVDNLERALLAAGVNLDGRGAADAEGSGGEAEEPASREVSAHEALAAGVALVHGELVRALNGAGVESFDPVGERFDPSLHEALSTRPAGDGEEPNVVAETLQRGYRVGESLIRPARVVVTS